ncbi:MAG: septum formation initiator family protein [Myxococcales bacterium]|jgi:cell division protein FtsB|nr:septum formation initiator family protein [Myxococcales bacterium]
MNAFYKPIAIAAALSAGLIAASAFAPNGGLRAQGRLQDEIADYERRNRELEQENQQLSLEIGALSGNPKVLERTAREALGLVRPDEVIFHFEE